MKFDLTIGNRAAWEKLRQAHARMLPALREATDKSTAIMAGRARELASGQVLKVRTGRLRSSILPSRAELLGLKVQSDINSNVEYLPVHELGLTIPARTVAPTRAKALRFVVGGRVVFAKKASIPPVNMPRRPVMQPGVEQTLPRARALLGDAVMGVFEE